MRWVTWIFSAAGILGLVAAAAYGQTAPEFTGNCKGGCVVMGPPIGVFWSRHYVWEPKADITTYELALALPALIGRGGGVAMVLGLPPEAQRHFREEK
jgi:hypothetical protein